MNENLNISRRRFLQTAVMVAPIILGVGEAQARDIKLERTKIPLRIDKWGDVNVSVRHGFDQDAEGKFAVLLTELVPTEMVYKSIRDHCTQEEVLNTFSVTKEWFDEQFFIHRYGRGRVKHVCMRPIAIKKLINHFSVFEDTVMYGDKGCNWKEIEPFLRKLLRELG